MALGIRPDAVLTEDVTNPDRAATDTDEEAAA